nr:putative integron gene cassette protein [uncultured bacterium]
MKNRTLNLLNLPDDILFRAGGCHVFALALRGFSKLPLLWIRGSEGYDHLACNPESGCVLDYFGFFTKHEYVHEEILSDRGIYFSPITEEEIRSRYTLTSGRGYYADPEFLKQAKVRAKSWISKHHPYFDGTVRGMIPGVKRATTSSKSNIDKLFQ